MDSSLNRTIDDLTEDLIVEELQNFGKIEPASIQEFKTSSFLWLEYLRNTNVQQRIQEFFNRSNDFTDFDDIKNRRTILLSAVCSLELFIVDNFLGRIHSEHFDDLKDVLRFVDNVFPKDHLTNVSRLIPLYKTVNYVRLIEFTRCIFTSENLDGFSDAIESLLWKMWSLRSTVAYQKSLQEYESSFHQRMIADCEDILQHLSNIPIVDNNIKMNIYCEIVNAFLTYKDIDHSKFYYKEALKLSKFDFEFTGCLGVRTIYQQKQVSQLTVSLKPKDNVNVQLSDELSSSSSSSLSSLKKISGELPPIEKLEDDTLLPEIKLLNSNDSNITVDQFEQCLFITIFMNNYLLGHSDDVLLQEELSALTSFLLKNGNVWSILYTLLNVRSLMERNSRRKVERSMKQMESLANCVRISDNCTKQKFLQDIAFRRQYFFTVASPPSWKIEKNLADLLYSLGLIKSALEIYRSLETWDQIIDCYRRINQPDKAEAIVREMITKENNLPYWYCLLGEVTGNVEHYQKARSLSDRKYSRPSKMLGLHYFSKQEYSESLKYLEESVSINYLQTDCWYRIGFISLENENWTSAAKAYRNVLQFEPDSFEAWNNLSKAYIKLGDKERALKTLQEAIKCNYDEWKLWDNYIAVALDVRAFNDCLMAFNRLLDLNKNYIDDKIISGLAYIVFENLNDNDGREARLYISKILELFARISSIGNPTHSFWRHYAHILMFNNESDSTKITQCLQKCHRKLLSHSGWEADPIRIDNISRHCNELYRDYLNVFESDKSQLGVLGSCKLLLNSALVQIKKAQQNLDETRVDPVVFKNILENIVTIEKNICTINEQINN